MGLYSLARKVSGIADSAVSIGKKISGTVGSIAKKVSSVARIAAPIAASVGAAVPFLAPVLEPAAVGLAGVSALGAAVGKGADMIGGGLDVAEKVSGSMRSGIERVGKAQKTYKKIKGVVMR